MSVQPSDLFSLYRFTPGRRGWMATQIKGIGEGLKIGPLAARCEEVITLERGLQREIMGWSMVDANVDGSALSQALMVSDQRRDRLLAAFDSHLEALIGLPNAPESRPAEIIRKRLFPSGSAAVAGLTWTDQSATVEMMIDDLRKGLHEDVVAARVESWVAALEAENSRFNSYYASTGSDRQVTWTSLRAADRAAQERFLELIAFMLDLGRGSGGNELRDKLFAPVLAQQRELMELHRSRRGVGDLDPDNGQPMLPGVTGPTD